MEENRCKRLLRPKTPIRNLYTRNLYSRFYHIIQIWEEFQGFYSKFSLPIYKTYARKVPIHLFMNPIYGISILEAHDKNKKFPIQVPTLGSRYHWPRGGWLVVVIVLRSRGLGRRGLNSSYFRKRCYAKIEGVNVEGRLCYSRNPY